MDDLKQRARELLAAEYTGEIRDAILNGKFDDEPVIRVIAASLASRPADDLEAVNTRLWAEIDAAQEASGYTAYSTERGPNRQTFPAYLAALKHDASRPAGEAVAFVGSDGQPAWINPERTINPPVGAILYTAPAAVSDAAKFKTYVHDRLDAMGVPHTVPGEHTDAGCRIGGRLDWIEQRIKTTGEPVAWNDNAAWSLVARAEAAGAARDEDDSGTWWTLRLEHFNALAAPPATPAAEEVVAWRSNNPETIKAGQKYSDAECSTHFRSCQQSGVWPNNVTLLFTAPPVVSEDVRALVLAVRALHPECGSMRLDEAVAKFVGVV
ncbi:hypothetical protein [Solilutibacter silvestris]|uniref:hypothetical protein n=1 Tax=Solilutibacter silvestris TaxID=1645665 RepID=UPI003D3258A6